MFHDGFIVLSIGQEESLLRLELPGRRPRGRAERQIYGRSGRGRELVCVKEEDAEERDGWRQMIGCCRPPLEGTSPKEKIKVKPRDSSTNGVDGIMLDSAIRH